MPENYTVRLTKESLVFSAAHFITFQGDICERLHGHNYAVEVQVHGPLDDNGYVVDFIALRDALAEIVGRLDHHVLLPTRHPLIQVREERRATSEQRSEIVATFRDRRWVFPSEDCVLLPVSNTTAELLAAHIGAELRSRLQGEPNASRWRLSVAVDENHGQWGIWHEER